MEHLPLNVIGEVMNSSKDTHQRSEGLPLILWYEFDAVFFLTANENLIGQQRPRKGPLRSPTIANYDTLKEVYTVRTY